ncbi:MAG TPA: NlpC/P60 family protein [Jatrophihabitans sp.]|jgi:cell wall-associated NlpC family hydrolase|uniref:C40 family peptidase n=1 Tax=Jatrophihabitans sp. TaxID=1932789 RepID=UPI002E09E524|nr:NlpC/P60 family protein [Jatrophihabitans sp.]
MPARLPTRRLALLGAAVAVAASVLAAPSPLAASPSATPSVSVPAPVRPSDAQSAQQAKTAADQRVGTLLRTIAAQTREIAQLTTDASQAEQDYQDQLAVQAQAQAEANRATADRVAAQQRYDAAHRLFVRIVIAAYEDGSDVGIGPTARLLVADDPTAALNAGTAIQMVANMRAVVTATAESSAADMRRADAGVAAALSRTRAVTQRLADLRIHAAAALDRSRTVLTSLQHNLVLAKGGQARATQVLSTFLGGWSVADPAAAAAINLHYVELAKQAAKRPEAPAAAHWTAAMGQTAAYRALRWIGAPYAWAGGGATGPSTGVCAAGSAHNDCHIAGFDCSGLAMFAWGPYQSFAHFAATQYGAGTLHPGVADLLPGDLVFWSNGKTAAGIHHVAIYVGDGNVVQAPQSGDIVRVTPLGRVSSGYFGATRPLT